MREKTAQARSLLELLPEHRRETIYAEAAKNQIAEIMSRKSNATLGEMVLALESNPYWRHLRSAPVASVFVARQEGVRSPQSSTSRHHQHVSKKIVDRILAFVEKNPGQTAASIVGGMPAWEDAAEIKRALKTLRIEGKVKVVGMKRGMTYAPTPRKPSP